MKTLLKIPFTVWVSIGIFAFISILFIIFLLLFKIEQTAEIKLKYLSGQKFEIDSQAIERIGSHKHLTIQSNGKFYKVAIKKIQNGFITLHGFRHSSNPGTIYKARFILEYTHIYSLLFGSV